MFAGAMFLAAAVAPATVAPRWIPRGVVSTPVTTQAMIARLAPYLDDRPRAEHYHIATGRGDFDVTALERGPDFRIDAVLDGNSFAMGRSNGASWRRTPTGTVRIIRSDVQGDDLDRWPRTVFGFYSEGCAAAGQAETGSASWVLYCRKPGDIAHFYFIDPASGRIEREVTREGAREVTYWFNPAAAAARPSAWRVSGAGGDENVKRNDTAPTAVGANEFRIPPSVSEQFALPENGKAQVSATFDAADQIFVPVRVNGKTLRFALDTGTSQMLMDVGVAARLGLRTAVGHGVAHNVCAGSVCAANLSVQTVDLFGGRWIDGLLGNEFFTGHVVHVDYKNQRVDLISHATFAPPADAHEVALYSVEGMPIVSARIGEAIAERMALDTGGPPSILAADFVDRERVSMLPRGGIDTLHYLEGQTNTSASTVGPVTFGPYAFGNLVLGIETHDADNADFPLDGIFGTLFLRNFEWWFDYDGNRLWVR
jgi:hypothetical protein